MGLSLAVHSELNRKGRGCNMNCRSVGNELLQSGVTFDGQCASQGPAKEIVSLPIIDHQDPLQGPTHDNFHSALYYVVFFHDVAFF